MLRGGAGCGAAAALAAAGPGARPAGAVARQLRMFGSREFPDGLKNRYFLVAHGESELESHLWEDGSRGLLLSNPGFKYDFGYGLTSVGRDQMVEAGQKLEDELGFAGGWIYTSNFQRAFQSALQLREVLGVPFSQFRTEFSGLLDPRKVGALDEGPQARMQGVWREDRRDAFSTPPPVASSLQPSASVESVMDVNRRVLEAITRLERSYYGDDVVLCSHCSTLSIYMAAMMGTDLKCHHEDWPFEVRRAAPPPPPPPPPPPSPALAHHAGSPPPSPVFLLLALLTVPPRAGKPNPSPDPAARADTCLRRAAAEAGRDPPHMRPDHQRRRWRRARVRRGPRVRGVRPPPFRRPSYCRRSAQHCTHIKDRKIQFNPILHTSPSA